MGDARGKNMFGPFNTLDLNDISPPVVYTYGIGPNPYRCPVCEGRGLLPCGFYATGGNGSISNSTADEKCRTCKGKGIVWRKL